jgi:hypothetical protein
VTIILLIAPAAFAVGALIVYAAPDRVRSRSVRWRQSLAVLGAIAGVAASGAATGLGYWDATLRAGLSAGVVLLGARARPKAVLATTLLLLPAAVTDEWALAIACGAAGVGVATALTVRRQGPFLTSLVGLLASQAALRFDLDVFHGADSIVAATALSPIVMSGYRNLRSAHRRRVRTGVLAGAGLAVLIGGLAGIGVLLARSDLEAGVEASRAGLAAGRQARTEEASRQFSGAANAFADARDGLEAAWVLPGRLLPVVGQNLRLLLAAAKSGSELAITASESAGIAEAESIRVENGRLDLTRVRELQEPLEESTQAVQGALADLDAVESPWILPPLAGRFEAQRADLADAEREAEVALQAVRVLPGLLGGDGPRRYFLAVQQPAELRGSGGIIGNYGELEAIDGALDVVKFGRDSELNVAAAANNAALQGAPADYIERYGRFTPERIWQNVSMSPNFPHVAEAIRVLYPQSGGQSVDGVISITPRALAALLRVTGPIDVPPWPEPITADNVEQILHTDQYVRLDTQERIPFLGAVAETVTRRLTSGSLPPPAELARVLSPVVRSGDLLLHSFVRKEQKLFGTLGADGALTAEDDAESFALITQNAGGNKLDAFLRRRLRLTLSPSRLRATFVLRNTSPPGGVTDAVNGSFLGDPPGTNRSYVSIHTERPLIRASIDGVSLALESEREAGLHVYSAYVVIPPLAERAIEITLGRGMRESRLLTVHHQPTILPDEVLLEPGGRSWSPLAEDLTTRAG